MSNKKQLFNPSPQNDGTKGKFNQKIWVKIQPRDLFNIKDMDVLIYNDLPLDGAYKKQADLYNEETRKRKGIKPTI